MSSYKKYKNSRFVTRADLGDSDELAITISGTSEENVSLSGQEEVIKPALLTRELDKPLILNWINLERLGQITGAEEMEDWVGHKMVLYYDPTITYGTKTVGGLRLKAAKVARVKPPPLVRTRSRPVAVANDDDEPQDRTNFGPPEDWNA